MASKGPSKPPYNRDLSTDAVPWSIPDSDSAGESSLTSTSVSVDAVPGRRYPGGVRLPQPRQTESKPPEKQKDDTEKQESMKSLSLEEAEKMKEQVTKKIEDLSLSDESCDSSYFSITDSLSSLSDEIEKYKDDMPPSMKAPFIDVLVLYSETDREEAEIFKKHLETEIILANGQKVVALLYDCPDFQSLSGSMLQHLDLAVERSTYVFVYLTKSFVEDNWCEISSESCLMKAIYDEEKRWCVVPVYTERRHQCKFKIPMGLNSLKGINYYNNDKFYRDGVARLIGDKVNVKFRMEEDLKGKQKKWIEKFKRDRERKKAEQLLFQRQDEEKTRLYKERLRESSEILMMKSFSGSDLYSIHPSSSTHSLKEMSEQNPHVAEYFHQLRLLALNQQIAHPIYPEQGAFQQPYIPPQSVPHIGASAAYSQNQHAVHRSPSQTSAISRDAANSHPIPPEILDKIKDLPTHEQQRYITFYQETQSMQLQQQSVMNIPPQTQAQPLQMAYPGQQTPYTGQMIQNQQFPSQSPQFPRQSPQLASRGPQFASRSPQFASPGPFQGSASNTDSVTDPLQNAPSLNLSLIGHGQQESLGSHVNQTSGSQEMGQASQVPNILDQSMNSYHPGSVPCNFSLGESEMTAETGDSFSTGQGSESHGQSVDCPRSNEQVGNLPNSGLFDQPSSLEEDSGTNSTPTSLGAPPDKMNIKQTISMEGDGGKGKVTETKKEKHVHYTINIYQANAVQVGDSNTVKGLAESESESDGSDDEEDINELGKDVPSIVKTSPNQNTPYIQVEEVQTPLNIQDVSTVPDAPPSAPPSAPGTDIVTNPFISANINRINTPEKVRDKPIPIGLATPIVTVPSRVRNNGLDDKDETGLKQPVPTDHTARKVVNGNSYQNRQSNIGTAQVLRKSDNTRDGENVSTGRQTVICRPAYSSQFGSSNVSNPSRLFGFQRVAPGDDPLRREAAPNSNMQESQGFQPDTENDHANNFDMCEDDYEGGEFTESVEQQGEISGTRKIFNTIFNKFSNKVK